MEDKKTQEKRCVNIFSSWLMTRNCVVDIYENRHDEHGKDQFPDFYFSQNSQKIAAVEIVRLCNPRKTRNEDNCRQIEKHLKMIRGHWFIDIICHGDGNKNLKDLGLFDKISEAVLNAVNNGFTGRLHPIDSQTLQDKLVRTLFVDISHYPAEGSSAICEINNDENECGNSKEMLGSILKRKGGKFRKLNRRPHILLIHDFDCMIGFQELLRMIMDFSEEEKDPFDYIGYIFNAAFSGTLYTDLTPDSIFPKELLRKSS